MMSFWSRMAPREQLLVLVAGALLAVFLLVQLLILPQQKALAAERAAFARVERDAAFVTSALAFLQEQPDEAPVASLTPDQVSSFVTAAAYDRGIAIARLNRGREGEVGVVIDQVAPANLFYWIGQLRSAHGIRVRRASISAIDGSANVRATLEFGGSGGL